MLQVIFFTSVNFCFTFVSNLLAYIMTPKNKGKTKTYCNKKIIATCLDSPKALLHFRRQCSQNINLMTACMFSIAFHTEKFIIFSRFT